MELTEEWRDVIGYEGLYIVSNLGRVARLKPGGISVLKPFYVGHRPNGKYEQVDLSRDGLRRRRQLHHLVLEGFVGPRPIGAYHGCHNDGNPLNNKASNLRWDTPESNAADKLKHGTSKGAQGSSAGHAKLDEGIVLVIRQRLADGEQGKTLAKEFQVNQSCISKIKTRKLWRHI